MLNWLVRRIDARNDRREAYKHSERFDDIQVIKQAVIDFIKNVLDYILIAIISVCLFIIVFIFVEICWCILN